MFYPLKSEVESRFSAVEEFFKATRKLPRGAEKTAKGLAFVHMYAVYEYAVRTAVQISINAIIAHKHPAKNLSPSLLALFLDGELRSLRDCGDKEIWKSRIKLFDKAFSNDSLIVGNDLIPTDGEFYRHSRLQMIFDVFGIRRSFVHRKRHLGRIIEVVNNRNGVAHGRETAEEVGGRYAREDVLKAIRQMKSVCFLFVNLLEDHCSHPERHTRN